MTDLHPSGLRLPDFLIIGAPRCGTTALTDYLRAHPDVFISARKELNYFDRVDPTPSSVERYASNFSAAPADATTGEATPAYLESRLAPERMATVVPDARLVACLRDPVDRAYSHYWWRRIGYWRVEDREFADAVADELAGHVRPGAQYLGYGLYHQQLERLLRWYPRTAILPVLFCDLVRRPMETYLRLCRHIGVRDDVRPDVVGRRINTAVDLRSPRLWGMIKRWRAPSGARNRVLRRIDSWNLLHVERPPMDPDVRDELAGYFEEHNARLAEWLGRDLSHWTSSA